MLSKMTIAGMLAVGGLVSAAQSQIYADILADSANVTFFGTSNLTGAPDGGGAYLSTASDGAGGALGYVTLQWSGGLTTGLGVDLQIIDVANSSTETADVWVSSNGVGFTFVGSIDAVNNSLDIDGLYSGAFSYVRIDNPNPDSIIDIDTVAGFYVPTPGSSLMLAIAGLACVRRRR